MTQPRRSLLAAMMEEGIRDVEKEEKRRRRGREGEKIRQKKAEKET